MRESEAALQHVQSALETAFRTAGLDLNAAYRVARTSLGPGDYGALRAELQRWPQEPQVVQGDQVVIAAALLGLAGAEPQAIGEFLASRLPSGLTLGQFEFLEEALFAGRPPLDPSIANELARYPFFDPDLVVRRSLAIAARLRGIVPPAGLLYLRLLTLREDVSNENAVLVHLVLAACDPASAARSEQELAAHAGAFREFRRTLLASGGVGDTEAAGGTGSAGAAGGADREAVSRLLDKYFGDRGLRAEGDRAAAQSAAAGSEGAARLDGAPAGPKPIATRKSLPVLALALGALLVLAAGALVALGLVRPAARRAVAAPPAAPSVRDAQAEQAAPAEASPAPRTYTVREGDSLWRIYRQLKAEAGTDLEWTRFLERMRLENSLADPDLIYPETDLKVPR